MTTHVIMIRLFGVRAEHHEPRVLRQRPDEIGRIVLAGPVGREDLVDDLRILVRDHDLAGLALVLAEHVHAGGHDAAVEFGIDDPPAAKPGVGPADDQFIREDRHRRLLGKVLQRLGPAQDQRLALGLLERFGEQDRAIQRDPRRAVGADGLIHPQHPVGHRPVHDLLSALNGLFLC